MRVLVADDHPIVRAGWATALAAKGWQVVAECCDGVAAVEGWRSHAPDLGLIDLRMPVADGFSAIAEILQWDPRARLVVTTSFGTEEDIYRSLRSGARGYLLKEAPLDDVFHCLTTVLQGGRYYPAPLIGKLSARLKRENLTPRQVEVVRALALGLSNKQIGARLELTTETVRSYVKEVLAKLKSHTRGQAVHEARLRGIL